VILRLVKVKIFLNVVKTQGSGSEAQGPDLGGWAE